MNSSAAANSTNRCDHPTYELSPRLYLVAEVLFIPQTIATALLNLALLFTFAVSPQLQQPQHYYFLNLAICDTVIGTVVLPSILTYQLAGCWPIPQLFCRFYKICAWVITGEAATTMMLIGYNRYEMISHGAQYAHNSRKTRIKLAISWIINLLIYVPPAFMDLWTGVQLSGNGRCRVEFFQAFHLWFVYLILNTVIPPAVVFLIYVGVYLAMKNRSTTTSARCDIELTDGQANASGKRENAMRTQTRAMLLVTAAFLITTCPVGIFGLISLSNINELYTFALFFQYLNSLLNTIIYTSKVPAVRNSLLKMFGITSPPRRATLP